LPGIDADNGVVFLGEAEDAIHEAVAIVHLGCQRAEPA